MRITSKLQQKYRAELGLARDGQVLFVTGGGNGSMQLNEVILKNASRLLGTHPKLAIIHVAGRQLAEDVQQTYDRLGLGADRPRVMVKDFVTDMYRYSGAADVIIARGGATGLAEFAAQGKACVIIPARQLVWQVHHAATLHKEGAIICLAEAESGQDHRVASVVGDLLDNAPKRHALAERLARFARPDAARELAMVLLEQASGDTRAPVRS